MKIKINDQRKIFAINEEFSAEFPNLKLLFFGKPSTSGGPASYKTVGYSKTLAECRNVNNTGELELHGNQTVSELEDRFRDNFGITVRILQRSGNSWGEIDRKAKLTLSQQNGLAQA